MQKVAKTIGGSNGGVRNMRPLRSNFFHVHSFFWQKTCQIIGPPRLGNPGSITKLIETSFYFYFLWWNYKIMKRSFSVRHLNGKWDWFRNMNKTSIKLCIALRYLINFIKTDTRFFCHIVTYKQPDFQASICLSPNFWFTLLKIFRAQFSEPKWNISFAKSKKTKDVFWGQWTHNFRVVNTNFIPPLFFPRKIFQFCTKEICQIWQM